MFIILLFIACIIDARTGRIPNRLILAGIPVAIISFALREAVAWPQSPTPTAASIATAAVSALIRTAIMFVILYCLYKPGLLGAGDVKLCCLCSIALPSSMLAVFICVCVAVAGILAVVQLIRTHSVHSSVRLAPAMLVGMVAAVVVQWRFI